MRPPFTHEEGGVTPPSIVLPRDSLEHTPEQIVFNPQVQKTLEFTRIEPPPPLYIKTGLTREHIDLISEWEDGVWGENGRPFSGTVNQFSQELTEVREIWIDIAEERSRIGDVDTSHHLREEIGDGIIAGIGILRHIVNKDNDRAAEYLYKVLNSTKSKRISPDSGIVLFQMKGQRLLERIQTCGKDCVDSMSPSEKNEILSHVGSSLKSGFEALEVLGANVDNTVKSKIQINRLKYSPSSLARYGGVDGAKKAWNSAQLPVVKREGDILRAA